MGRSGVHRTPARKLCPYFDNRLISSQEIKQESTYRGKRKSEGHVQDPCKDMAFVRCTQKEKKMRAVYSFIPQIQDTGSSSDHETQMKLYYGGEENEEEKKDISEKGEVDSEDESSIKDFAELNESTSREKKWRGKDPGSFPEEHVLVTNKGRDRESPVKSIDVHLSDNFHDPYNHRIFETADNQDIENLKKLATDFVISLEDNACVSGSSKKLSLIHQVIAEENPKVMKEKSDGSTYIDQKIDNIIQEKLEKLMEEFSFKEGFQNHENLNCKDVANWLMKFLTTTLASNKVVSKSTVCDGGISEEQEFGSNYKVFKCKKDRKLIENNVEDSRPTDKLMNRAWQGDVSGHQLQGESEHLLTEFKDLCDEEKAASEEMEKVLICREEKETCNVMNVSLVDLNTENADSFDIEVESGDINLSGEERPLEVAADVKNGESSSQVVKDKGNTEMLSVLGLGTSDSEDILDPDSQVLPIGCQGTSVSGDQLDMELCMPLTYSKELSALGELSIWLEETLDKNEVLLKDMLATVETIKSQLQDCFILQDKMGYFPSPFVLIQRQSLKEAQYSLRQCMHGGGRGDNSGFSVHGQGSNSRNGSGEGKENSQNSDGKDQGNDDRSGDDENHNEKRCPSEPTRDVANIKMPVRDFKTKRKKHSNMKNDDLCDLLGAFGTESSFSLLIEVNPAILDDLNCCLHTLLHQVLQTPDDDICCTVCNIVQSLLNHFVKSKHEYMSCTLCRQIFSLTMHHVQKCIKSGTRSKASASDICLKIAKTVSFVPEEIVNQSEKLWSKLSKYLTIILCTDSHIDGPTRGDNSTSGLENESSPNSSVSSKDGATHAVLSRRSSLGKMQYLPSLSSIPEIHGKVEVSGRRQCLSRKHSKPLEPHPEGNDEPGQLSLVSTDTAGMGSERTVESSMGELPTTSDPFVSVFSPRQPLSSESNFPFTEGPPSASESGNGTASLESSMPSGQGMTVNEIIYQIYKPNLENTSTLLPNQPSSLDHCNNSQQVQDDPYETQRTYGITGVMSLPIGPRTGRGSQQLPSLEMRPVGEPGIGEVVYGTRRQLMKVALFWMQIKNNVEETGAYLYQRREEGVILAENKKYLKILRTRYQKRLQWEKLVHLGSGVAGKCYLATDLTTELKFCVKRVHIVKYEDTELEILSDLNHTNIVRLYGAIRKAQKIYIFSEFIDGGNLTSLINEQQSLNRRLSHWMCLRYLKQLLQVLVYLKSRNIIHEDLKADNILLKRNTTLIAVTDFGLARRMNQDREFRGTSPTGSQTQWSPEKASSDGHGFAADVWAAICVLVHMLSGDPPWKKRFGDAQMLHFIIYYQSPPLQDIPKNIQLDMRDLIVQGFTCDPRSRPSAAELLQHTAFHRLDQGGPDQIYSTLLTSGGHIPNNQLKASDQEVQELEQGLKSTSVHKSTQQCSVGKENILRKSSELLVTMSSSKQQVHSGSIRELSLAQKILTAEQSLIETISRERVIMEGARDSTIIYDRNEESIVDKSHTSDGRTDDQSAVSPIQELDDVTSGGCDSIVVASLPHSRHLIQESQVNEDDKISVSIEESEANILIPHISHKDNGICKLVLQGQGNNRNEVGSEEALENFLYDVISFQPNVSQSKDINRSLGVSETDPDEVIHEFLNDDMSLISANCLPTRQQLPFYKPDQGLASSEHKDSKLASGNNLPHFSVLTDLTWSLANLESGNNEQERMEKSAVESLAQASSTKQSNMLPAVNPHSEVANDEVPAVKDYPFELLRGTPPVDSESTFNMSRTNPHATCMQGNQNPVLDYSVLQVTGTNHTTHDPSTSAAVESLMHHVPGHDENISSCELFGDPSDCPYEASSSVTDCLDLNCRDSSAVVPSLHSLSPNSSHLSPGSEAVGHDDSVRILGNTAQAGMEQSNQGIVSATNIENKSPKKNPELHLDVRKTPKRRIPHPMSAPMIANAGPSFSTTPRKSVTCPSLKEVYENPPATNSTGIGMTPRSQMYSSSSAVSRYSSETSGIWTPGSGNGQNPVSEMEKSPSTPRSSLYDQQAQMLDEVQKELSLSGMSVEDDPNAPVHDLASSELHMSMLRRDHNFNTDFGISDDELFTLELQSVQQRISDNFDDIGSELHLLRSSGGILRKIRVPHKYEEWRLLVDLIRKTVHNAGYKHFTLKYQDGQLVDSNSLLNHNRMKVFVIDIGDDDDGSSCWCEEHEDIFP